MKARIVFVLILALMLGTLTCGKKNPSGGGGVDFEAVEFMKQVAGVWIMYEVHLCVYDTTSGAVLDDDVGGMIMEGWGEVPFGTSTAFAELNVTTDDTIFWVADEDQAVWWDKPGDPEPFLLIDTPIKTGHEWQVNPDDIPAEEITGFYTFTDSTEILPGGIFHDVIGVRIEPEDNEEPFYLAEEMDFARDLSFITYKMILYTRTHKKVLDMVAEAFHTGSEGLPKASSYEGINRLLQPYRQYLPKWIIK